MKAADLAPIAEQVGREFGIDPWQLMAHADKESSLRPTATSSGGKYVGLLQMDRDLMAKWYPGKNPLDPLVNLRAGAGYYASLLKRFGEPELALAAYNWGPAKITGLMSKLKAETWDEIRGKVPFSVRWYVSRIGSMANNYRRMWETP